MLSKNQLPTISVDDTFYRVLRPTPEIPNPIDLEPMYCKPRLGRYGTTDKTLHLASTTTPGAWAEIARRSPGEIERRIRKFKSDKGPMSPEKLLEAELPGVAIGMVCTYKVKLDRVLDLTSSQAKAFLHSQNIKPEDLVADPIRKLDEDGELIESYPETSRLAKWAEKEKFQAIKAPSAAILDFPEFFNLAVFLSSKTKISASKTGYLSSPTLESIMLCNYYQNERPSILNEQPFSQFQ